MAVGAGASERSEKVLHVRYNLEFDSDQKIWNRKSLRHDFPDQALVSPDR
jgi:hypothetical protein